MLTEVGLLCAAIALTVVAWKKVGGGPLPIALAVISSGLGILAIAPLGFSPISFDAAIIICIGLLSLTLPALVANDRGNADQPVAQSDRRVAFSRLLIASIFALVIVGLGYRGFVGNISTVSGGNYSDLSLSQIRAAQIGETHSGGISTLAGSSGPILGCLGVYGALRFSRLWIVLTAASIWVALQSPARTTIATLFVIVVVFYLYAKKFIVDGPERQISNRYTPLMIVTIAGIGVATVFNSVGSKLGKTQTTAAAIPQYSWPDWTLSPSLYFSGGYSAFSKALEDHSDPFDQGGSYFIAIRALNALVPTVDIPRTVGGYVYIPVPINIYTGFGRVYFDLGIAGVIVLFGFLGWLAIAAHRRAMTNSIEWSWVSAVLASVLLSLPQSYTLFTLDIDFPLVLGFVVFWAIGRSRRSFSDSRKLIVNRQSVARPYP